MRHSGTRSGSKNKSAVTAYQAIAWLPHTQLCVTKEKLGSKAHSGNSRTERYGVMPSASINDAPSAIHYVGGWVGKYSIAAKRRVVFGRGQS